MNDIEAWLNGTLHEERTENSSWDLMAEIEDEREVLAEAGIAPVDTEHQEP